MKKQSNINQNEEMLIRFLADKLNDSEAQSVLEWINEDVRNKKYFEEMKAIYEVSTLSSSGSFNVEASLNRVKAAHYKKRLAEVEKEELRNRRWFAVEILKYAALIIFLSSLGIAGYRATKNKLKKGTEVWNTIEAPFGSRAKMTLTDGTQVWLNAGSKLKYSSEFNQKYRTVYLDGEAYFNVTEDKDHQFIVSTPYVDVKVFGTEFNVKAYKDENTIQATLVRGSVIVESRGLLKNRRHKVLLKPNETATFRIQNANKTARKADELKPIENTPKEEIIQVSHNIKTILYTSWKDDKWVIDGVSLSDLAIMLERRYNVSITFSSRELANYKFRGIIRDETLEQVLNVIKLSAPVEFTIRDNHVNFKENRSFKNQYDEMLLKNQP